MRQNGITLTSIRAANLDAKALLLIVLACVACITEAHADGGAAQFTKSAGPFVITVFTSPSPLRAGPVDISLMIQNRDNQQAVLDSVAHVELRKDGAMSISAEATHEAAQNKLLYAAQMKIPESGVWELEAAIKHGDESANVTGVISVAPSNPVVLVYWRSLALPPVFISLFALNQWLKRRSHKGPKR